MMQPTNPARERMQAGEVALGLIVRLARSGDIARIAKTSGHDFIFIDGQHAIFSMETIGHLAQAALGCGVAPLVRVRSCDDPDIPVLLDNGVTGIIVPDVSTAEQAQRAVSAAKYAPIGRRSVGGGATVFDHALVPLAESIRVLNDLTLVVCMIETVEGLENVNEIAAVEGVDVLHVGCSDLSVALGKPGSYADPEIVAALDRVIDAAARHGKYAGLGGDRDLERQVRYIRRGVRFVTTQADLALLLAAATQKATEIRAGIE
ncbi:MAG: HpcH/HpaI aldolase family protein [Chloroflexota bacterium]